MTDQAKRSKALRTIASLQKVVDHPNTGDGERQAAQGRIDALREKHGLNQPPPPRRETRTGSNSNTTWGKRPSWQDFNSTSSSNSRVTFDDMDDFLADMAGWSEAEKQAHKIRRQQAEYDAWRRGEDQRKAQQAAARKAAEEQEKARQDRVRAARERERQERLRKEEAQRRWRAKHANSDAMGQPLTEAEKEEARRDPLGWASKQDGRTANEKNRDLQDQYSHTRRPRCIPETFFDQGGEPRKRNQYATECYNCGILLQPGHGCLFKVADKWKAVCCETVPGPRKKKRGRE